MGEHEHEHEHTTPGAPERPRRRILRTIVMVVAGLVAVAGIGTALTALLWPDQVEQAYGQVQQDVGQWRTQTLGEKVTITLGATGGKRELSRCDGTFTQMASYESAGEPPVWAAHNNCGGDVILPVKLGDIVAVTRDGTTSDYVVVDIRETPKVWVTTDAIIGMSGELIAQTCFFGGSKVPMKFVGLDPVAVHSD